MNLRLKMMAMAALMIVAGAIPAWAQDTVGRVAPSAAGDVGARQQTRPGVEPLLRVDSRIQSRVQSRIRNRIDRYYDPQANAEAPFATAVDQARTTGRRYP